MDYEKLCMYCFQERGTADVCPHCGRDSRAAVPQIQMLPGTRIFHNRFLIGRALGQDASGIVYAAYDTKRDNDLRIREYMPRDSAERTNEGTVVPIAGMEDRFEMGMKKLKASVESVSDPAKRHFYFEENGTAYIAQRRSATAAGKAAAAAADRAESSSSRKITALVLGILAAIIVVAVAVIALLNNSMNPTRDVTVSPSASADSGNIWLPVGTATPQPTQGTLIDPNISWSTPTEEPDDEPTVNVTAAPGGITTAKPTENDPTARPNNGGNNYGGNTGGDSANIGGNSNTGGNSNHGGSSHRATATPAPAPTVPYYGNGGTVWNKSSEAEIRQLQTRLAELGWLPEDKITGKYGTLTASAVKSFQAYINTAYNLTDPLEEDGIAGQKTQEWLYRVNAARPTQTPAPGTVITREPAVTKAPTAAPQNPTQAPARPTPTPKTDIDKNSSETEIRGVQQRLIQLGLLPEGSADGKFGKDTEEAVRKFQSKVNEMEGMSMLPENGVVDELTLNYMDVYVQWMQETINSSTPAPTLAPTDEPDIPMENPDVPEDGGNIEVKPDSPVESIRFVQEMLMEVGVPGIDSADGIYGNQTKEAIKKFQQWVNRETGEATLPVTGEMDSETLRYLQGAFDYGKNYNDGTGMEPEATDVPYEEPDVAEGDEILPDADKESVKYVQNMLISVGYLRSGSADGSYGDNTRTAVRRFQERVNEIVGEGTLSVTGECDAKTLGYLEYYAAQGSIAPTTAPTDEPTQAPAEAPNTPVVNVVTNSKVVRFNWDGDSAVEWYDIVIRDSAGNKIYSTEGYKNTEGRLEVERFRADESYTITVTAVLKETGDRVSTTRTFSVEAGTATDDPTFGDEPEGDLDEGNLPEFGVEM